MIPNIKQLLNRSPYAVATAAGAILIFLWRISVPLHQGILGLMFISVLIGIIIGFYRIVRWYDVFKQFPLAFGCYLAVAWVYWVTGLLLERREELEFLVIAIGVAVGCPFLLAGEFLGWIAKPSNHSLDRPAAQ